MTMKLSEKYNYNFDQDAMTGVLNSVAANIGGLSTPDVLHKCFSMMDLTTLHTQDTDASVGAFVGKLAGLPDGYPMPASVCVFSNFASVACDRRPSKDLHVTITSACFPSSQSFLEVKLLECRMGVQHGADEVDVVLALNKFCAGDYDGARAEIQAIRQAIDEEAAAQGRSVVLKVILETGLLVTPEKIAEASFLAMEVGADFIKTSTGKVDVNATPAAAYVMCQCIKAYYAFTGRKVGFKPAGGISTAEDALSYYYIVSTVLGPEWLDKKYFRFGVSRLGNALMSASEGQTVKFF